MKNTTELIDALEEFGKLLAFGIPDEAYQKKKTTIREKIKKELETVIDARIKSILSDDGK